MTSPDRLILRGMLWVAAFAALGRLTGAAKEVAIAWRFGVSAEVDGYVFVSTLVTMPAALLFSVLCAALVPLIADWPQRWDERLRRFARQLAGVALLIGLGSAGLAALAVPAMIHAGIVPLPEATAAAAIVVSGPLAWAIPLGLMCSLGSAWMLAANRHANTLYEALPALVILGTILFFAHDLAALAWATVAGLAVHGLALAWSLLLVDRSHAGGTEAPIDHWHAFLAGLGITVGAQVVMLLGALVDQFFAAPLAEGSLSVLGYATRVASLALAICAMAIGRATLPVFSVTKSDAQGTRQLVNRWTTRTSIAATLACVGGVALAPALVELLFQRGAFTADDTSAVATTLRVLLLQVPPYCAALVLVSWASATRRLRLLFVASLVGVLVKLAAASVLVPSHGLTGLASATVLMYVATLCVMFVGYTRAERPLLETGTRR